MALSDSSVIDTPILQLEQHYIDMQSGTLTCGPMYRNGTLDLHAMAMFASLNFFFEDDTYLANVKTLKPAHRYLVRPGNAPEVSTRWRWYKEEHLCTPSEALRAFAEVLDGAVSRGCKNKKNLLSISSGIDSRNLAAALCENYDVESYSYGYKKESQENRIAAEVAAACGFKHASYEIPRGYLWDKLDDIAARNHCEEDPCIVRQVGVLDILRAQKRTFVLGHIGDILFDRPNISAEANLDAQLQHLLGSFVKPGGMWIAETLWRVWGLDGNFQDYAQERFVDSLKRIEIGDAAARLRALRLMTWVPRFTSLGVGVFDDWNNLVLPFYDDAMAPLVCEMPERYLANRKLQLEYIRSRSPKLAAIVWDKVAPYSINTAHRYGGVGHFMYRVFQRARRTANHLIGNKAPISQRNWELQLLDDDNLGQLKRVFDETRVDWLPSDMLRLTYDRFKEDPNRETAYAVGALLAMCMFAKSRPVKSEQIAV